MKILLIFGTALVLAANVAVAQEKTAGVSSAAPTSELDEVIVTGTRRLDRTVAESSAAIDVLSGTELANYPTANMLDTLSNLVPSFIVG
jgi:iron complex outermembrane receptor protein